MLDDLKTNFNDSNNNNNNNNNSNNNNESNNINESNNENVNESENESGNENESHKQQYYEIEEINNISKNIDETKSFKDQVDILKKNIFK